MKQFLLSALTLVISCINTQAQPERESATEAVYASAAYSDRMTAPVVETSASRDNISVYPTLQDQNAPVYIASADGFRDGVVVFSDLNGRRLREWKVQDGAKSVALYLHGFDTGTYLLIVRSGKQRKVQKVEFR